MLNIRIITDYVEERRFVKDGKEMLFREQYGNVFLYGKDGKPLNFAREVKISLDKDQSPYPIGEYILSPASVYLNRYQQLEMGRLVLIPRAAATAPSQARVA